MPHSGSRSGVTGMQVTLVDNLQMLRLEGSLEYFFNPGNAVHVGISPCSNSASTPVDSLSCLSRHEGGADILPYRWQSGVAFANAECKSLFWLPIVTEKHN